MRVGDKSRPVVAGVRASVIEGDAAPAVAAVMGLVPYVRTAIIVWTLALIAGVVLVVLGGDWRLAGFFVLGVVVALGIVAIVARAALGKGVRAALAAAKKAAYRQLFS